MAEPSLRHECTWKRALGFGLCWVAIFVIGALQGLFEQPPGSVDGLSTLELIGRYGLASLAAGVVWATGVTLALLLLYVTGRLGCFFGLASTIMGVGTVLLVGLATVSPPDEVGEWDWIGFLCMAAFAGFFAVGLGRAQVMQWREAWGKKG